MFVLKFLLSPDTTANVAFAVFRSGGSYYIIAKDDPHPQCVAINANE